MDIINKIKEFFRTLFYGNAPKTSLEKEIEQRAYLKKKLELAESRGTQRAKDELVAKAAKFSWKKIGKRTSNFKKTLKSLAKDIEKQRLGQTSFSPNFRYNMPKHQLIKYKDLPKAKFKYKDIPKVKFFSGKI